MAQLGIDDILTKEITEDVQDFVNLSNKYFSGKYKTLGDIYGIGTLRLENYPDLEIVIEICEQDITDNIFYLDEIRTNGEMILGFFKLNIPNINDHITKRLSDIIKNYK